MDTDFPEGYIEVANISYKKIWSQIFPQEICKLHVSFGKHGWKYSCMEFGVFHISYRKIWAHMKIWEIHF